MSVKPVSRGNHLYEYTVATKTYSGIPNV